MVDKTWREQLAQWTRYGGSSGSVGKMRREQWLNPGRQEYDAAGDIAAVRKWTEHVKGRSQGQYTLKLLL